MAQDHAHRLVKDLESNKELHDKIAEASRQALEVAKQHGYDVSDDEVREALGKRLGMKIPKTTEGKNGVDPLTCFVISETPGQ